MLRKPSLALAVVILFLWLDGCGGETAVNPIEPGGKLPALLAALPDGDYVAVGYLDIDRLAGSEIGRELLGKLAPAKLLLAPMGIDPDTSFHELALAVGFEGRSYPNFYRSLPLIAALRADIPPAVIKGLLPAGETETFEIDGKEVTRYQVSFKGIAGSMGGAAFLSFPEEGLALFSTSLDLMEGYFKVRSGNAPGIGGEGTAGLLARADMRAAGWMALRHSDESRSLLRMIAGFDDCIISLTAAKTLKILCVMDFPGAEEAQEAIKYFEFTREELQSFKQKAAKDENEKYRSVAKDASLNLMLAFKAQRSADLAIFSAEFDSDWFSGIGMMKSDTPERGGNSKDEQEK